MYLYLSVFFLKKYTDGETATLGKASLCFSYIMFPFSVELLLLVVPKKKNREKLWHQLILINAEKTNAGVFVIPGVVPVSTIAVVDRNCCNSEENTHQRLVSVILYLLPWKWIANDNWHQMLLSVNFDVVHLPCISELQVLQRYVLRFVFISLQHMNIFLLQLLLSCSICWESH